MTFDWCRHCGQHKPMTEEHLPPRSAGNDSPVNLYNEQAGDLVVLRSYSEGHTIPSLCDRCNNEASNRGLPFAYKLWRKGVIDTLQQTAKRHGRDVSHFDIWASQLFVEVRHGYNLHPGRIVRQALGMILAVQARRHLLDDYPQLAAAYRSDGPASIAPLALHVALVGAATAYVNDALMPSTINLSGRGNTESTSCWLLSFPPFLIILNDRQQAPITASRIDQWLEHPINYHFRKGDRSVSYPIADKRALLVSELYRGCEQLRRYKEQHNRSERDAT